MSKILAPKKILIINNFGIGDVLFTTPVIKNLKIHDATVKIDYLCNLRAKAVLVSNPHLRKLFIYERDEWEAIKKQSQVEYFKKMISFFKEIRRENYDCVLDFSLNSFFSFLSFAAGIQTRVGFNYKNRSPFLNYPLPLAGYESKHVVEYYLDILKVMNIPVQSYELDLAISAEDELWAENWLKQKLGSGVKQKLIAMIPGGGASWGKEARFKRWDIQKFIKLADKIVEKTSSPIILCGDISEKELCSQVEESLTSKCLNACGDTSLGQMAALLKRCQLVIANDGGPLHVAVAVGTKTVSIFGPVDENVYGPYPMKGHSVVKKNLSCQPCYRQFRKSDCQHISCLQSLSVEEIFKVIQEII